jgi:hypothetical protein
MSVEATGQNTESKVLQDIQDEKQSKHGQTSNSLKIHWKK